MRSRTKRGKSPKKSPPTEGTDYCRSESERIVINYIEKGAKTTERRGK